MMLSRWSAFFHDMLWVPVSLFASFWLRFNLNSLPSPYLQSFFRILCLAIPVFIIVFWRFGLYRGIWRFASVPDIKRILKSVLLGTMIVYFSAVIIFRMEDIPRTVLILFPMFLISGLSGPRLFYRLLKDRKFNLQKQTGKRTLVVGAGRAGEMVLRELRNSQEYLPIALLDDDVVKHSREIHGVRVWGSLEELVGVVNSLEIELVLFAIPSAKPQVVANVIRLCSKADVECRTLPPLKDQVARKTQVEQIRPFILEDLLCRIVVCLDEKKISGYLRNKNVLVTGCGGSIGSELCRQIAKSDPARLILLDNCEFNLYSIDSELRCNLQDLQLETILGDVKNRERVDWAFRKYSPDVVFHAAAYKHVPMLEINQAEAVQNNVIGTQVIAEAADRYGVERFVFVSTDKAVNPSSVMGVTKRISELYCQNLSRRSKTKFVTTRFGNVLGSAGSVVPLFEKQIKMGGPVTVTHPDISRYFMTIPEAVSLILQAGAMGNGGEIYVLDMGEPVRIKDLAEQMIRISGMEPERDIKITYIGLRPGEKLFEELFHEGESLCITEHPKVLLARSRQVDWQWLLGEIKSLNKAATCRNVSSIACHLCNIVPEYNHIKLDAACANESEVLFRDPVSLYTTRLFSTEEITQSNIN